MTGMSDHQPDCDPTKLCNCRSLPDPVKHPQHYTSRNIRCRDCGQRLECIQITQDFNFNLGNVIKYVFRAGSKGDELEDLYKARQYLDFGSAD